MYLLSWVITGQISLTDILRFMAKKIRHNPYSVYLKSKNEKMQVCLCCISFSTRANITLSSPPSCYTAIHTSLFISFQENKPHCRAVLSFTCSRVHGQNMRHTWIMCYLNTIRYAKVNTDEK